MIPGDINGDGKVNILDLNTLGANFDKTGTWAQGDLNGDGKINILDLNTLGANFNAGVPTSSAMSFSKALAQSDLTATPEPTSLALLVLSSGLTLLRRRRAA